MGVFLYARVKLSMLFLCDRVSDVITIVFREIWKVLVLCLDKCFRLFFYISILLDSDSFSLFFLNGIFFLSEGLVF